MKLIVIKYMLVLLMLLLTVRLLSGRILVNYVEARDFCMKYGFVLYVEYEEGILTIESNGRKYKFTGDTKLVLVGNEVYLLEEAIVKRGGAYYLPYELVQLILKGSEVSDGLKILKSRKKRRIDYIVLDPGHGGRDPGNVNNGIEEKDLNLLVSKKLYTKLKEELKGVKIYLTRKEDKDLTLEDRAKLVNGYVEKDGGGGMFISIHANASLSKETQGIETFFYSAYKTEGNSIKRKTELVKLTKVLTGDKETNKALSILYDLNISRRSNELALYVHESLYAAVWRHSSNRGIKSDKAYFVVTNNTMPAILVEMGFLTNEREAEKLLTKGYQTKLVNGLANGIIKYINDSNVKDK